MDLDVIVNEAITCAIEVDLGRAELAEHSPVGPVGVGHLALR